MRALAGYALSVDAFVSQASRYVPFQIQGLACGNSVSENGVAVSADGFVSFGFLIY
jgi:hypothetical protein